MKTFRTAAALLLALLSCLLGGCSMIRKDESRIVVATVGEYQIAYDEYSALLEQTYLDNGIDPETDSEATVKVAKDAVIQSLIDKYVRQIMIGKLGLGLDSDKDDARTQVAEWKQSIVDQYVGNYNAMDDDDALYYATQDMEVYRESYGLTDDYLYEYFLDDIYYMRLFEYVTAGVSPTEEDIQAEYERLVADAEGTYTQDNLNSFAASYESGAQMYYIPEGIFYFKRILIPIDSAYKDEYSSLTEQGDAAGAEAAVEEGLSKIKGQAEEVLGKLQNGAAFDTMLSEHIAADGVMSIGDAATVGLLIYPGCASYDDTMTAAVLQQLKKDGDLSGLIGTPDGYYLCLRVSTLTAGAVPLQDVYQLVRQKTLASMQDELFVATTAQWQQECSVTIDESKL